MLVVLFIVGLSLIIYGLILSYEALKKRHGFIVYRDKKNQYKVSLIHLNALNFFELESYKKTSFGVKKSDIYKEEIFSELSDKEKKVARKKFRNTILSLSESLTQEKDKTRLEKLKKAFLDFYKQVYKVNDFSLSSVCSENMKETNKEILKKVLQIIKK